MSGDIHIRREGRAGRITLDRPAALNALTYDMTLAMTAALEDWAGDEAIDLVAVDGAGGKAFCAGGDIQKLYQTGRAGDIAYGRRFWRDEYRLDAMIAGYPKPYVALMDGIVMGGGVGISAHGSHRVVTERSVVAMPEASIGFLPDVGGMYLLSRAPGRLGEYLAMTGTRMGPADAVFAGFADVFVPVERLGALLCRLTRGEVDAVTRLAAPPPAGDLAGRRPEIDAVFDAPDLPAIVDRLEAHGAPWAAEALAALRRNAPLSVACALEAVRRARGLPDLAACLALEYRFAHRSVERADFLEGIRAAVIDKDRRPAWRIARLDEVRAEDVAAMLAPLGADELTL